MCVVYPSGLGLYPLSEVIKVQITTSLGHSGCPLSGVERWPLQVPNVIYYIYRESNRGHGICPWLRGLSASSAWKLGKSV